MSAAVTISTTAYTHHQWEVDDLEHLPKGYRYEIVGGVLYMSPMPELRHGAVVANLFLILAPQVLRLGLGRFFPPQTGVYWSKKNYLDPDLLFLRASEYEHWPKRATRGTLAVEVLSPSNTRAPREVRERLFRRMQVEELWYVDPVQRTLEVRGLIGSVYTTVEFFREADTVTSSVLPGVEFSLAAVWEGLDSA